MSFNPKRGDVVAYNNYLYFFQPNGTACYLYLQSDDIGIEAKRVLTPRRTAVSRPDPTQCEAFLEKDKARRQAIKGRKAAPPPILPEIIESSESPRSLSHSPMATRKVSIEATPDKILRLVLCARLGPSLDPMAREMEDMGGRVESVTSVDDEMHKLADAAMAKLFSVAADERHRLLTSKAAFTGFYEEIAYLTPTDE